MSEGMLPGLVNDGVRALIAQIKKGVYNKGSDIASAGTTNICATGTSPYVDITGTTTITSFGTAAAGCWRILQFDGALTLTHNATSLIIPSGGNITTAAGDVVGVVSEGSGNWRVIFFSRVPFLAAANTFTAAQTISTSGGAGDLLTLTGVDAGASGGPTLVIDRSSSTPAAADQIGLLNFQGRDSAGNPTVYARFLGIINDPTNGSEDGAFRIQAPIAGSETILAVVGPGFVVGSSGTDKGLGTLNAQNGVYVNGHGTIAQVVRNTNVTYQTCGTILPVDNTIPQNTEGDEILSVAITPTNASSILRIRVTIPSIGQNAAGGLVGAALFVDTTANALAAGSSSVGGTASTATIAFEYSTSAGSTSARTYKVRLGSAVAGDAFLNGSSSTQHFNGVSIASLEVEEILPQ